MSGELVAKVSVVVTSTKPLKFHFVTTDLPMGPDNVLYFRNCRYDQGFLVYYELQGAPGYRFPPNKQDAMWAKVGAITSCPSQSSVWGQFKPDEVLDGDGPGQEGRVLKVWNRNHSPAEFSYTLRITNGSEWLELDPGGINQNGGQPLYSQAYYYIGAAVVGGIATYAGLYAAGLIQG